MNEEQETNSPKPQKNILWRFDSLIKKVVPNFNVRAILYFSLIFGIALFLQIWHISSKAPETKDTANKETVVADDEYWQSKEYQEKIQNQTVESFTNEFASWLKGADQEFVRRKFEDILFINNSLTTLTGGNLDMVVPESFNYLENHGKARYQYAKEKGFLSDTPALVQHGQLVCDIDEKTERTTGIELYEWRYASMPKLAEFMKSKPDWKIQIDDRILDVSDPRIEDKDLLKLNNAQTQPAGLFSFLVFRNPQTNRIYLADSHILEANGVDDRLTLSLISSHYNKLPKLYFKTGFEGCKQITNTPEVDYGHAD